MMEVTLRQVKDDIRNMNTIRFADDIMLWREDAEQIQRQLNIWTAFMKDKGLKRSRDKTEVMVVGRNS